jgi:CheY-like chemotaxis protein
MHTVVDDNDINRRVLQRQLEAVTAVSLEVHTASNGQEALDLYTATFTPPGLPYDLIFMDVEMPVMDGMQATSCIRRHEHQHRIPTPIPILGLSGNARQVSGAACIGVYLAVAG